jgi:CRP/FNR family transcriptional regulator, cyclic AMP receptor protein
MSAEALLLATLGYGAALLTIVSQQMRTMIPLRVTAIGANLLFIGFGALGAQWNVLALHLVLLPLNLRRLRDMQRLIVRIRDTAEGSFDAEWLRPYARRATFPAGTLLFRRGDAADAAYYLLAGEFRYLETGRVVRPGQFFGDFAIFAEDRRRTNSGVCDTAIEALVLDHDELVALYLQNPRFGFYYVRNVVRNLREHIASLEATRR